MLNPRRLIFYDRLRKRKIFFRLLIVLVSILFIGISSTLIIDISSTQARYVNFDADYYYSEKNYKKLALTFDDGPFPVVTDKILDILEENDVPATFFLLGKNIAYNQDIVKRIYDSNNEIGNHTFTHSPNVHKSEGRIKWELDSTNKLIEDITGHSSILYRPPFLLEIGSSPTSIYDEDKKDSYEWVENNGYLMIGSDIDPKDWAANSSEEVTNNLSNKINDGHLILLHDDKNENNFTVNALDSIIKKYKSEGYEFVTVSELFGLTRDDVMLPTVAEAHYVPSFTQRYFIGTLVFIEKNVLLIINTIIFFVIFKILLMYFLILFRKKKIKKPKDLLWKRPVTVLIPAYNEEENIASTIKSVVNNGPLVREILVINDGSTDKTESIVRELQEKYNNILLVNKENGGKASALNLGIKMARYEIIISIDSDTIIEKNSVASLVRHFKDKKVAAVAGKIMVANNKTILGAFQSIEYTVGQNIEKNAFARINAVGVIPGAIGAWRKSDLVACGGYSDDTLVEDQDLTLAILQSGKKILYEPEAIAYTETPVTISGFYKQRFRWVFGTLQCFWKYKKNLFSKNLSLTFIILPNIAIYNTFIPLLFPIIDVLSLISILNGNYNSILLNYNLFTLFDILYASVAFTKQKDQLHLLSLVPIQRIFYRFVIYVVVFKSLVKAIEGTSAFWNKLERTGQVAKLFSLNNSLDTQANSIESQK